MTPTDTIPADSLTYAQALAELETIVNTLQSDKCDVDRMVSLTRRATELLASCRRRLTATDDQLRQALAALTPSAAAPDNP